MKKNMCICFAICFLIIGCSSYVNNETSMYQQNKQIEFGTYTINSEKYKDPIVWDVIKEYGDKKLLLARNIIDYQTFYKNKENEKEKLWNNSYLRQWLNTHFYNTAFTEEEKNQIIPNFDYCEVMHTDISYDSAGNSNYTHKKAPLQTPLCEDKVFLLTYESTQTYNMQTKASVTPYAIKKAELGKNIGLNGYGTWWLATTQYVTTNIMNYQLSLIGIATINEEGIMNQQPIDAQLPNKIYIAGVRPAIWIKSE